ncbi:hypothetical protein [Azospirillum humicireducens]|uniref:hypothetical protein n=1 Tax=Azospirillum humicireducens TaxID=1226968 RepID=UPI000A756C94|nr:hypothetical protein [Azospirillum humicireducens]
MANISVFNLTGTDIALKSISINGTSLPIENSQISMLGCIELDYRLTDWKNFSGLVIEIQKDSVTYKADLNKDHYFGGGDYRYPGSGSKVRYILSGLSVDGKKIQMNYAYNSPDLEKYKYSNDMKYLDAK